MGIHNVGMLPSKEKMAQTLEEENQIWSTKIWEAFMKSSQQWATRPGRWFILEVSDRMSKRSRWQLQGKPQKRKGVRTWGDKSRQRQWGQQQTWTHVVRLSFPAASFLIDFEVWNRGCKEKVAAPFTQWRREREFLNRSSLCLSLLYPSPHPSAEVWVHMCYLASCVRDQLAWKQSQRLEHCPYFMVEETEAKED